jgi:XTP/dITP diphosphohydrolase
MLHLCDSASPSATIDLVDKTITLLIATRNDHKVGEIRAILGPDFSCLTLKDFPDAPPVIEDAETFAGNATKKAVELAKWLTTLRIADRGSPISFVLADDSGLEVDALEGKPGIHSARFAAIDPGQEGNSKDADNNAKLLRLLHGLPPQKFTARFRCVIALVGCHPPSATFHPHIFSGTCEGRINLSARGAGGFGYDPLFVPDGYELSFAELGEDAKNRLSHRAKALAELQGCFAGKLPDR